MTIINFEKAKLLKESTTRSLKDSGIHLKIPTAEISFWINLLTYITHTIGQHLQQEIKVEDKKILQKEYRVLQDTTERILVFNGFHENEILNEITFSLNYEEMIILEGQLEQFTGTCIYYGDDEYLKLTEKYLNTFYKLLEEKAETVDIMTKMLVKEALSE